MCSIKGGKGGKLLTRGKPGKKRSIHQKMRGTRVGEKSVRVGEGGPPEREGGEPLKGTQGGGGVSGTLSRPGKDLSWKGKLILY